MPRRRPSIRVQWTLRYGAAMLVTLSLFMAYAYDRVERRIYRQARLLLSEQTRSIVDEIRRHPGDPEAVAGYVTRRVEGADPELDLSVALFDGQGRPVRAWGLFARREVPLLPSVAGGGRASAHEPVDVGLDEPYLVRAARVPGGYLQVGISSARFAGSAGHIRDVFLLALPIVVVLTGLMGWWLARGSLRPIREITGKARAIGASNLEERLPTTGSGDELDRLSETLNEMIGRIEASVASLRRFSADAAHQLRTPLAALRAQIEITLEKERAASEYRRVLEELGTQVEHLAESVNAMLRLAQSEAGLSPDRRQVVDLFELLETVVEFFQPVASERGVDLEVRGDRELRVAGDPSWLHQLFANLLHNALKYTPRLGRVEVELGREGACARVRVSDTGAGIPPEELDRIFERFHQAGGRESEPGSGLGLTIAREIARAHDGDIAVASAPGRGATFSVRLPLWTAGGGLRRGAASPAPTPRRAAPDTRARSARPSGGACPTAPGG